MTTFAELLRRLPLYEDDHFDPLLRQRIAEHLEASGGLNRKAAEAIGEVITTLLGPEGIALLGPKRIPDEDYCEACDGECLSDADGE